MRTGKVVKILNPEEIVVSLGADDGVESHDDFLIYALGDEIVDPESGESLGQLEIVRGRGEVRHLQPKLTTVRSTEKKKVMRDRERKLPGALGQLMMPQVVSEEAEILVPFSGVKVGDLARVERR